MNRLAILMLICVLAAMQSFQFGHSRVFRSRMSLTADIEDSNSADAPVVKSKGFGKPPPKKEGEPKDIGTQVYETQAKRGIPEYNIFLRPVNGTESDWIPVGSMTIPRDTPVIKAVLEVEEQLLQGTFKLYPKLKALYQGTKQRDESAIVFDYGYVLKVFPDEPIKLVKRDNGEKKNFFSNWLSSITNPLDTSELKEPGMTRLKQ